MDEQILKNILFSHSFSKEVESGSFYSHHHLFYELLFIVSGSGLFLIEDTAYEFSGSTVIVVPPQRYHVLKIPPQHDYERYVVHFPPELLPPPLRTEEPVVRQADEDMLALFERSERGSRLYGSEVLRILQGALVLEAMVALTGGGEQNVPATEAMPPLVQSAVRYICSHLDSPLDSSVIAKELYVSKTYLSHLFAKTMNISLMRYVRLKKMYRAREYLRRGMPVMRVAYLLGYDSYPTFLRNYRAEFGDLPSQLLPSEKN